MNTLTAEEFRAERQPNGDVWIIERIKQYKPEGGPEVVSIRDGEDIIIYKKEIMELVKFLLANAQSDEQEWTPNYNQPHRVDYTHYTGEPE